LTAVSPFRYGLAAVILSTVAYATLGLFPMIQRDTHLLNDEYRLDQQGIELTGELRDEIDQARLDFAKATLAAQGSPEEQASIRAMRQNDASVAQTAARLSQPGRLPDETKAQFDRNWAAYVSIRDKALNAAPLPHSPHGSRGVPRRAAETTPADSVELAFARVAQSVNAWNRAYAIASAQSVEEVSRSLRRALADWNTMMAVKLGVLALLIWTDWRRDRAEKQLQLATAELRATQDRLHLAFDSSAVGMGIIALDGTILSINAVAARNLGYSPEEQIGKRVRDFIAPQFIASHDQQLRQLARSELSSYCSERQYIRKDGTSVWIRNNVNCMRLKTGERQCFFTSEDVTLQRLANDRLAFLANFDPVTSLPNRHYFEEQLAEALRPVSSPARGVALLYLEIDSFDFLKGTFGRNAADEVLSELAASLTHFQQQGELVGRLDDHVFGIIMRAAPYDQATVDRASELREIFHHFSESGKHRIPLSASIGIAYSEPAQARLGSGANAGEDSAPDRISAPGYRNGPDAAPEALLKYARAAMLEARSRGGDAIFVADPALQERAVQRHQIESALLHGLRQDEFRVVFQPQFQVSDGSLVRFEALCRWNSSELGTVPPDRFIPIAEQTGLISEIGRRVMQDALHQARMWTQSGRRIGVAVNISPMQFMRPDFTEVITDVLASSGFPPELLELEITEGIFIRDLNLAVARIRELQRLGLSVALDDFGTGYSSLSYLQRMPIDAVKLDRSFVSDLTTDSATVSMVRSVLSMAEALHLRVVSEGVETDAQLQILRSLGCDEAQGYLLGRPESAELALRRVLESPLQPVWTTA
jgi:PAS domain S-box-containing protein/diguanylate cyclase (GGDEF)-like protein